MDDGPIRVMLVEDAAHVRRMLRSMLELDGFEVVAEAATSAEAIAAVLEARPDVVIVDYRLPDADGLETSRRLIAVRPGQVVVLYTAFADGALDERAAEAGVALVLAKEAGLEPLEREIARLFPDRA